MSGREAFAYYLCVDPACGLRFPVTPADRWHGDCPRCRGPVVLAAPVVPQPAARQRPGPVCPLHLLLDNWRSLFNVGAAFRTADGAAVAHLHLCGITPTPEHRRLAKTALGAERSVDWSYAANGVVRAGALQVQGFTLWVLEGGAGTRSLYECLPPPPHIPLVLAAGNEITGVDPGILALADQVVSLPMAGIKGSLNVAVALSIVVYWLRGQASRREAPTRSDASAASSPVRHGEEGAA